MLDYQLQQDIDRHLVAGLGVRWVEGAQEVQVATAGWVLLVVETHQGTAAACQVIHLMLSLQRTVPGYHYGARTESQTQPHLNNHLFSEIQFDA